MKFLNSVSATVGLAVVADSVVPVQGLLPQEMINFIASLYSFSVVPPLPPQPFTQAGIPFIFQNGRYTVDGEIKRIIQLTSVTNGDLVTGVTSDDAEIIMLNYIEQLNKGLGFRYNLADLKFRYVSNVTVQFDQLKEKRSLYAKIEDIIQSSIPTDSRKFQLKRLTFGEGDFVQVMLPDADKFDRVDFVIEHRNSTPDGEYVFFSIAPLKTSEHVALLEKIEQLLVT